MTASTPAHAHGLLLTAAGVLVLTPDALLIRVADLDPWTMLFWRGLMTGSVLLVGLALLERRRLWSMILGMGGTGALVTLAYAVSNTLFVFAINNTLAANALAIIAAAPLWAALFSVVLLRESVPLATWIAAAIAISGIALIFSSALGSGGMAGNLAALGAGIMMALIFTLIRRGRSANMIPATAFGAILAGLAAWPLAAPSSPDPFQFQMIALNGMLVQPLAFAALTLGPRTLPAPEVSLLMLLETVLGPMWVWLALREQPPSLTLWGGGLVVATLAMHAAWRLRRRLD